MSDSQKKKVTPPTTGPKKDLTPFQQRLSDWVPGALKQHR
jgi:hypothetical protein